MAQRERSRRPTRWLLVLTLLEGAAASAEIRFEPSVSVGISHTDNVSLSATDPERATIYQLRPQFTLTQESRRFTTDLDFGVEAYRYDEIGESEAYQAVAGNFRAALDPENFWLDVGAAREQTIRDPDAPIPWSNLPITLNRLNRDNYYVGPSFDYPIGSSTNAKGTFRRDRIRYDQDATSEFVREFDTDSFGFSFDNYRKERGFSWAAKYTADRTDFGVFEPWEYRQAGVEIGGWVTPRFRLFAGAGKESPWDDPFDPSLEDDYWEAGIAASGETLMAEVATGDRTFGSSGRASLDFLLPRWQAGVSYSEQPTSFNRVYHDLVSSLAPDTLDDLLTRPGTTERYISKMLTIGAGIELSRTSVSLALYDEDREQRTSIDGVALEDEAQSGVDLTARWRAGSRTEIVFGVRRAEVTLDSVDRRLSGWSIGAERDLGQRTSLSLSLGHNRETSAATALVQTYEADVMTVLLTRKLYR